MDVLLPLCNVKNSYRIIIERRLQVRTVQMHFYLQNKWTDPEYLQVANTIVSTTFHELENLLGHTYNVNI